MKLQNNINYLINIIVKKGAINMYKWIKEKGLIFSLEPYNFNEDILINELELNWMDNTPLGGVYDNDDVKPIKSKNKIIIPCLIKPYRRRNNKHTQGGNNYSKYLINKINPSIYPKSITPIKQKAIYKR